MCDTNILVRAVISPFGPAAKLLAVVSGKHALISSPPVLVELYQVLGRQKIRALHRLSDAKIRRIISRFYKLAVVVPVPIALPAIVRLDPKDDAIVMTAILGRADVLCTLDQHLHTAEVVEFCASHGVSIRRDSELLLELREDEH